MSDRTAQARAEAERRVPARLDRGRTYPIEALDTHERNGFMQGVEWADANPQPHTITQEELAEAVGILEGEQEEGALGTDALYQALIHLRIEVEGDEWVDEPLSIDRLEVTQTVKMSGEPMNDNSKAIPNGPKDLDFFDRARALDAAATAGPWGVEGGRFGPEAYRNGQAWGLNWRQDLEWVAASRTMLPAAVEALARVRALHEPVDGFEGDPSHWECNVCSDERGPKRWPCATYQATEADG